MNNISQFLSEGELDSWSDVARRALLVHVCHLVRLSACTFDQATVVEHVTPDSPEGCVTQKAKTEWLEFFTEGIFSPLLNIFVILGKP